MVIRFGVLTVSDRSSRGERPDTSGPVLEELVISQGWEVVKNGIVPDDMEILRKKMISWVECGELDVILTTGGTGFSPRDVTPEATLSVVDKVVPGLTEAMRRETARVTQMAILSRAAAGVRGRCLIINLPGSPKAVRECLEVILPVIPHAVEIIKGEVTEHKNPAQ